eukprot:gene4420-5010_t
MSNNNGRGGEGREKKKRNKFNGRNNNGSINITLNNLSINGHGSSITQQKIKGQQVMLPTRSGFGKAGRKIQLSANFFEVSFPDHEIYQYDVTLQPSSCPRQLNREIIEKMVAFYSDIFGEQRPVYDGRNAIFTIRPLTISPPKQEFLVKYNDEKESKDREFKVTIKYVAHTSMLALHQVLRNQTSSMPHNTIQAMDVAMRHLPSLRYIPVGRSFFSPPDEPGCYQLGNGREVWFGYHQSLRPSQWKMMINLDISSSAFYKTQPVLDLLCKIVQEDFKKKKRQLRDHERVKFLKEIKGLKIQITHLGKVKRKYRVTGVTLLSTGCQTFKMENDGLVSDVIVASYFLERYNFKLKYPNLPCLQVGDPSKSVYLPIEVCEVVAGQRCLKKLNEKQSAEMIKATVTSASRRKKEIQSIARKADFSNDPYVKYFGIQVKPDMTVFDGRVIDSPVLQYGNELQTNKAQEIKPRNGVWNLQDKAFRSTTAIDKWALVLFVQEKQCSYQAVKQFVNSLVEVGHGLNMPFAAQPLHCEYASRNANDVEGLFSTLIANHLDLQLIVAVLSGKTPLYAEIKRLGDTLFGVPTQCIQMKTVLKAAKQSLANVCLKVNAKLGGINGIIAPRCKPKRIFDKPVVFLGADVTHPGPGDDTKPSIAAVVGSIDAHPMHYCTSVRVQKHRQEMIAELSSMVREILLAFYRSTRNKPSMIIMYRDGVSEGQFAQIVQHEVHAIRQACKSLEAGYEPGITFLVVQKRHHARFFAERQSDQVGKAGNIPPGTIVDRHICHPSEYDFYLCSHAGIQGTSKPAHYHVLWDDNNITADELQQLTYMLCHTYVRCTRSVSIPAPAYYAHLAAFRARFHLMQKEGSIDSGSRSTPSVSSSEHEIGISTMTDAVRPHVKLAQTLYFA